MVKVVLVNNEYCSLEELACEFGSNVEVAGSFFNLSEAMGKLREMKANAMSFFSDGSEKQRLRSANATFGRSSDNGVVFVVTNTQAGTRQIEDMRVPITASINYRKAVSDRIGENKAEEMMHQYMSRKKSERITLWENERIVFINAAKIVCCFMQKGQRKVTVVVENKLYKSNDSLNAFLEKFGENRLVRCHRSFAINPNYLLEMLPGENNTMVAMVSGYDY
jgi:DNA-binding LytR/AlgR family response regulator